MQCCSNSGDALLSVCCFCGSMSPAGLGALVRSVTLLTTASSSTGWAPLGTPDSCPSGTSSGICKKITLASYVTYKDSDALIYISYFLVQIHHNPTGDISNGLMALDTVSQKSCWVYIFFTGYATSRGRSRILRSVPLHMCIY